MLVAWYETAVSQLKVGEYAIVAGIGDEALLGQTGWDWVQWCEALDDLGAASLSHREIASAVASQWPEVGGWWTQSITVGYERIRGLRAVGQARTDKTFAASKSRTFEIGIQTLYDAFSSDSMRARWLLESPTPRKCTPNKMVRWDWPDGTRVVLTFTEKGPTKSTVAVEHLKLASAAARTSVKAQWQTRFEALAQCLDE